MPSIHSGTNGEYEKGLNPMRKILRLFLILATLACEDKSVPPDIDPPEITITYPADGAILTEPITIRADATDNDAVKQVIFLVDDEIIGQKTEIPYEQYWDNTTYADGEIHTILAKAIDNSDNIGLSNLVSIIVTENIYIKILSPNGGVELLGNSNCDIIWESSNSIDSVKIEYSFDGGISFELIIDSLKNQGFYTWLVANKSTDLALVKISDMRDESIFDTSDNYFSILKPASILVSWFGWHGWNWDETAWVDGLAKNTGDVTAYNVKFYLYLRWQCQGQLVTTNEWYRTEWFYLGQIDSGVSVPFSSETFPLCGASSYATGHRDINVQGLTWDD